MTAVTQLSLGNSYEREKSMWKAFAVSCFLITLFWFKNNVY